MPAEAVVALKAHVAINVRNVERSIEFYRKMFGIEPSKVRTGYAKFDVQNPPLNFTLNQVPFKDAGALSHSGGFDRGGPKHSAKVGGGWSGDSRRAADRLLLCDAGQDVGA